METHSSAFSLLDSICKVRLPFSCCLCAAGKEVDEKERSVEVLRSNQASPCHSTIKQLEDGLKVAISTIEARLDGDAAS